MQISRRDFHRGTMASSLLGWASINAVLGGAAREPGDGGKRLFFGDLHNHNAVGYAKGSLERSIDLAREHLDFFAFTGHASWHDMPTMPENRHMLWVNGFKAHSEHWPKTRQLIREANDERFVALLGYEWHSSQFGDYCLIFPEDQEELFLPDHVEKLLDFAEGKRALAIPHHVGYKQGWRGANFSHFRSSVSPVVEIFSEHGCTETDRSPYPMLRHSLGGRSTANTIVRQLAKGLKFGFVASSDDHLGYPGAYGEGGARRVGRFALGGRPRGGRAKAQHVCADGRPHRARVCHQRPADGLGSTRSSRSPDRRSGRGAGCDRHGRTGAQRPRHRAPISRRIARCRGLACQVASNAAFNMAGGRGRC